MELDSYRLLPCEEEAEDLILKKIDEYADAMAPAEPHTEEEQIVFKAVDAEGKLVGGCVSAAFAAALAVVSILTADNTILVYGYSVSLAISAAVRFIGAFGKTSVVYIQ